MARSSHLLPFSFSNCQLCCQPPVSNGGGEEGRGEIRFQNSAISSAEIPTMASGHPSSPWLFNRRHRLLYPTTKDAPLRHIFPYQALPDLRWQLSKGVALFQTNSWTKDIPLGSFNLVGLGNKKPNARDSSRVVESLVGWQLSESK